MSTDKQRLVSKRISDDTVGYHNQIKPEIQREEAKIGINNDYNPKWTTKPFRKEGKMPRIQRLILTIFYFLFISFSAFAQEGQIVRETIDAPSLRENSFGDTSKRQITVYLPPSYDVEKNRNYPVVYLLHGYTGNNNLWTGGGYIAGNIQNSMASWVESEKLKEIILVMPNSHNKLNGSWYSNSSATGRWGDYISKDVVNYIDSNYRTLPQPQSRGVIGHSMGGYGGMKIGMLYPEVFSCMGSLAGWFYDSNPESSAPYKKNVKDWTDYYSLAWSKQVKFSRWAAFCPNPKNPPFFCDFPYIYDENDQVVKNPDAFKSYMENDIRQMVDKYTNVLKDRLAIYIDCGTSDELIVHARDIREKLNKLGIKHVYNEFSGGHACCVMTSTGEALEVFSKAMEFDMLTDLTDVESIGKLAVEWGFIKSN